MRNQALLRMIWMSHELMKPTTHDDVKNYHRKSEEKNSEEMDTSKDTYTDDSDS